MSKKSKRVRRSFSDELKQDLVVKQGYSFKAAAEAVDVSSQSLREWHEKLAPSPEPCGEAASVQELQAEVKRLRKQLKTAEMEREILRKAAVYSLKKSQRSTPGSTNIAAFFRSMPCAASFQPRCERLACE